MFASAYIYNDIEYQFNCHNDFLVLPFSLLGLGLGLGSRYESSYIVNWIYVITAEC